MQKTLLPSALTSAIFLAAFIIYAFFANGIFANPDTSWHLAAGDYILSHYQIPAYDPWGLIPDKTTWLNISWAWDCLISIVFKIFGATGLYVFMCAFGAFNVALLASNLKARGQTFDTYIILTAALAGLAQYVVLFPQPQLATFLFTLIFHRLLHTRNKHNLILLPLIMVLWVNMHGGFIVGFTLIGAFVIEAYETKNTAQLKILLKLGAACAVACFINPFGIHIIEATLRSLNSVITAYLDDWHPLTFGNLAVSAPLFFFILVSNPREPNIRLADKILAFTWLLAGLATVRNFIIFTLVSAPYFAYCLQEVARSAQREKFYAGNIFDETHRKRFAVIAAALFVVLLSPFGQKLWLTDDKTDTDPDQLKKVITLISEKHKKIRFINDYNLGGNLIYTSGGTWRNFVDGRAGTAYSEERLADAIAFNTGDGDEANAVLEKYEARGIIVSKSHLRASQLPTPAGKWKRIFENDKIMAFIRP